jgi:hypothetical protein
MAKKVLLLVVGALVEFLPDKGNRNPDGKQVSKGKVIRINEDDSADILVRNHEDNLGQYLASGVFEGDGHGFFNLVDESKLSREQLKEYNS